MANFSFSARDVAPSASFDPIPAGWYDAKIVGSEIKPTKDGSGRRLNLQFEIIGGQFNNRKVFEGLNIVNSNSEAQRISLENLSAICHAINVMDLQNTEQLHGKPLQIKVSVKPAQNGYEASNSIKGYESSGSKQTGGGATQGAAGGGQAPTRQAAPARQQAPQQVPQRPAQPARQAPATGGRPAAANGPVRQAPQRQQAPVEQHNDVTDYNDNGGQFEEGPTGDEVAPWDQD